MVNHCITISKNAMQLTDNKNGILQEKNGRLRPEEICHEKNEENG